MCSSTAAAAAVAVLKHNHKNIKSSIGRKFARERKKKESLNK
jgi:hypothetical protein